MMLLMFISFSVAVKAQKEGNKYCFTLYYNYTVSSKLYDSPRDPDFILREHYQYIDRLKNFSFDFRYSLTKTVSFGIGAGYLKSSSIYNPVQGIGETGPVIIDAEDAFELFPLELSVYYLMPFSTEDFKFFMGGGVGVYFGNHIRKINDVSVNTLERDYDFGIHVIAGMDYFIYDYLAVRGQMKFRDPQFEMKSGYDKPSATIDDENVLIRQESFYTKVNVDGIIFSLGASLYF